jgi:hypothetical protein
LSVCLASLAIDSADLGGLVGLLGTGALLGAGATVGLGLIVGATYPGGCFLIGVMIKFPSFFIKY